MNKVKVDVGCGRQGQRSRNYDGLAVMSKSEQIVPQHVGFILDGNRRWAKKRLLSAAAGHIAGYKALGKVLEGCFESGIKYVSLYVFSTEN